MVRFQSNSSPLFICNNTEVRNKSTFFYTTECFAHCAVRACVLLRNTQGAQGTQGIKQLIESSKLQQNYSRLEIEYQSFLHSCAHFPSSMSEKSKIS